MNLNNFIFTYQVLQAWNKADKQLSNHVRNVPSPCFTSKDWIVRWGGMADPVFATKVQQM